MGAIFDQINSLHKFCVLQYIFDVFHFVLSMNIIIMRCSDSNLLCTEDLLAFVTRILPCGFVVQTNMPAESISAKIFLATIASMRRSANMSWPSFMQTPPQWSFEALFATFPALHAER